MSSPRDLIGNKSSWLIDNDRDIDGMQVITDLHGGDPEDMSAKAEFQEIKDRVNFDVSGRLSLWPL